MIVLSLLVQQRYVVVVFALLFFASSLTCLAIGHLRRLYTSEEMCHCAQFSFKQQRWLKATNSHLGWLCISGEVCHVHDSALSNNDGWRLQAQVASVCSCSICACVSVCVCVCVTEKESVYVCVRGCVCACVNERKSVFVKERESVCVWK